MTLDEKQAESLYGNRFLTERAPATGEAGSLNMKAANFPVLDVTVDDFRLQERALGR